MTNDSQSEDNTEGQRRQVSKTQRREEEWFWHRVFNTWPLWFHLILCIVISAAMVFFLDGFTALDASAPRFSHGKYGLHVSDVTTLISAALVLVKICTTSVATTSSARCIFILLEKKSLDLVELQRIATWKIVFWPIWHSLGLMLTLLLALMFPQQLLAPLLSGAVQWGVSDAWGSPLQVPATAERAIELDFYNFTNDSRLREWFAKRAPGYASLAWGNTNQSNTTLGMNGCRHIVHDTDFLPSSKLLNATLPYIKIHDIAWDSPNATKGAFPNATKLSVFGDDVLRYYHSGNAVLYDPQGGWNWTGSPCADFPTDSFMYNFCMGASAPEPGPPLLFNGQAKLLLMVARQNLNGCNPIRENPFGNMSHIRNVMNISSNGQESCYTMATVNLTAGVVTLPESRYITNRVVEGIGNGVLNESNWVREALSMMPDVMSMVSLMNTTEIGTWNSLDKYAETLIRYSYLASWDALTSAVTTPSTNLVALPYQPQIQASVTRWRVAVWLVLNLLMTLSAVLLRCIQATCTRSPVSDTTAALLMTDIQPLLNEPLPNRWPENITNLSFVASRDKKKGRFKLCKDPPEARKFSLSWVVTESID